MGKIASIVIGSGFGDEGKGLATDHLCCHSQNPLVIRFNGGHQAGHTVVTAGKKRHVFSNFGAGTLRNAPSYWSAYCTFSLPSMLKEYEHLLTLGTSPVLYVDNRCPVTTHYDVLYNRVLESARGNGRHGSCGLGFGATIERHEAANICLYAGELLKADVCAGKLLSIRGYYRKRIEQAGFDFDSLDHDAEDQRFMHYLDQLEKLVKQGAVSFVSESGILSSGQWSSFIFEGAQGILLDMDFGYFPHVTRSNTTSKNALAIIDRSLKGTISDAVIHYITRAYQTRHGQGPMTNENAGIKLVNNHNETNSFNEHQGSFRTGALDLDQLNYALSCDNHFSRGLKKSLLVTCIDQLEDGELVFSENRELKRAHYSALPGLIGFSGNTLFSMSDCAEKICEPEAAR
jgi:adenylosuccinate synthase